MKEHKMLKIGAIILAVPLLLVAGFLAYHQICLWVEGRAYPAPGTMVEVNGHSMHVYAEGDGEDTLVFLSGSGTAAPALDFKALYSRLSMRYRIAVVERAGYGFSDVADTPRDLDTVLEETRTALRLAGEEGPYILFPHSLSGIEALYWAQQYPDEIRAIVGLDAAVPPLYLAWGAPALEDAAANMENISVKYRAGLARLQPEVYNADPAMTGDVLSRDEKAMYKAVVMRSYMTGNMVDEARYAYANAALVESLEKPVGVPVHYFLSDGTQVGEGWRDTVTAYLAPFTNGAYTFLDCGHYVHGEMPAQIAAESAQFIDSLPPA